MFITNFSVSLKKKSRSVGFLHKQLFFWTVHWVAGDLVVLDNFTNAHGRMPWTGQKSDRKLGVALTY